MARDASIASVKWTPLLVAVCCTAQISGSSQAGANADFEARSTLDRYCVTCHNEKLRTAGLALDRLDTTDTGAAAEVWETVVRKLRSRAMPPPGRPRPDEPTQSALVSYLETSLDRAAAARPNPGRTDTFHRLNRTEYDNAIRDLLHLDVDVAALLPPDSAGGSGFDNTAGVLSISPALVERYVSAARKISQLAVGRRPSGVVTETYRASPNFSQEDQADRLSEDFPFGSRGGFSVRHYFPVDGEYSIKVRLQTNAADYLRGLGVPHQVEIRLDGVRVRQFTVGGYEGKGKPAPASFAGYVIVDPEWETYMHEADSGLEVRIAVKAGRRRVGASFVQEWWEPDGILHPREVGHALSVNERPDGDPAVRSLAISGPFAATGAGDTPSRREVFVCHPKRALDEPACARTILSRLARRAYRRPVTEAELTTLVRFFETGRREGDFESGIQLAIQRLLADPKFLFRVERDPAGVAPNTAYPLGDEALASRLSFFLWSGPPDDELLAVASKGKLKDPAVLERQARRLLADDRAVKALVNNFAGQWLLLRNLGTVTPDADTFPDFDDNLREAFQRETELFIASGLREDRSVVDLLTADYTFVNERLARHYGIPNVYGNRFRRVALTDARRSGLLGHASLLTVTSYPNRTSPVLRGKWILDNILGTPPPPPPPNVPALPERGEGGRTTSVRERLEEHRKNPACAACHAQMDPLGFALENFDAIGMWRTRDGESLVDASGALPAGPTFQGPTGLRTVLVGQREQFVRNFTERLLMYALGRSIEYYDLPTVRRIASQAAHADYRWSSLVLGIVKSMPFQMRRSAS